MMMGAPFADGTVFLFLGHAVLGRFKKTEETTAEVLIYFVHADVGQSFFLQIFFYLLSHIHASLQRR